MVDLNAHEAGNGGQSQGKPTTRGVLLYSEREGPAADPRLETIRSAGRAFTLPASSDSNEKRILLQTGRREPLYLNIGR
jgi:hypothetical protein